MYFEGMSLITTKESRKGKSIIPARIGSQSSKIHYEAGDRKLQNYSGHMKREKQEKMESHIQDLFSKKKINEGEKLGKAQVSNG